MNDVAAAAGVSQATVSMVLNQSQAGRVSAETSKRVLEAAKELGFRTNVHAKVLREGRSRMIGFVGDEVATTPFAGEMILGAQQEAWRRGYVLLTVDTAGDGKLERAAVSMMQSYQVAGMIFAAMYHRPLEAPQGLGGMPTVFVNAQDPTGTFTSVFPDEVAGGRAAARVLLDAGHRDMAMINIAPEGSSLPAASGRLQGFVDALAEAGVALSPERLRYGAGGYEDGLLHGTDLLSAQDRPTAIFCGNDRTALGAYHAAQALGLSVPDDVSIVGFDNQGLLMPMFSPRLTTFQLPLAEMGRLAVARVLDGDKEPTRLAVECSLQLRDSVAPVKVLR
ncbi:LacI family DNA-binding transcriptional regulator [Tessaracoccus lubricantis]